MKVVYLTNIPSPYRIEFFNKLGEEVDLTVIFETRNNSDKRKWKINDLGKKFKYIFINEDDKFKFTNIKKLLKVYKQNKYDIYIIGGYSTIGGMLSILYLKFKKIPFIINADGGFINKNESKLNYNIKKYFISSANNWLSTGDKCDEYFIYYGADKKRIYQYPFASVKYDNSLIKNKTEDDELQGLKEQLGLKGIVLITVGRFIKSKGIDLLLESLKKIQSSNKNISLLIVGGGELKKEYTEYVNQNNIQNVKIIDFVEKEKLIKLYNISDIFVFPTRYDVWGLVVNEAMAMGLPIISSDMAVASYELVKEDKNGYLFESDNVNDLTEKIELLVNDKNSREKFGFNSKRIIEGYSIDKMAQKHIQIFRHIQNN